ncbi:MAG: hypothetical protein OEV60_06310 [Actinomycetota bacterium]|nr:hypothetical protein [Actinomycetota bacterium]MDH5224335.1 hypothetical protein [Actinomycetota bacterium]MDH5313267.1 hypothetical protein [Actinomycetota bacterium]
MARTFRRPVALALAAMLLLAAPALAGDGARRRGSCSGGPGDWTLRVRRVDGGYLRVRFAIDDVKAGQPWQLFLSDNGTRIYSGTKRSTSSGEVHVSRRTRNRAGSDRIAASGVNTETGTSCDASLRY